MTLNYMGILCLSDDKIINFYKGEIYYHFSNIPPLKIFATKFNIIYPHIHFITEEKYSEMALHCDYSQCNSTITNVSIEIKHQ